MRLVAFIALVVLASALAGPALCEEIAPLAVPNKSIGGGRLNDYTPGVEGGSGLNNIGLLIKTWGKVTFVDTTNKFFYVNDGSARDDGSGSVGIRISYDNLAIGNTITPPAVDQYVAITGISSTVLVVDKVQPNLRPRRQSDIVPISL